MTNNEASKFLLKIQDNEMSKKHEWKWLNSFGAGKFIDTSEIPLFDHVPSEIDDFIERQKEMYEII